MDSTIAPAGADITEALEAAEARRTARRAAALASTARTARWARFARDPDLTGSLIRRAVSLAHAKGTEGLVGNQPAETVGTLKRLEPGRVDEVARVVGHVQSSTGTGTADLIDAEGCSIASAPVDALGNYTIAAEATGEVARVEIRDAEGQVAVLDGRPVELTPGRIARRDFRTVRCDKVEPVGEDPETQSTMPELKGMTVQEAQAELADLGDFRLSFDERHADEVPADTVLSQFPDAGRPIAQGDTIQLGVSLGPEPLQDMPDLKGMTEKEVRRALAELTFKAVAFAQVLDPDNAGRVVKQTPEPDAPVGESTEIELCLGVARRLMPKLVGRTRREALEILVPDYVDAPKIEERPGGRANFVVKQHPPAGVAIEGEVLLVVATGRAPDAQDEDREDEGPKPSDTPSDEGPESYAQMPDVLGLTRGQALKRLTAEGIDAVEFDEAASRRRGVRVLEQEPSEGEPLQAGEAARLKFGKPD